MYRIIPVILLKDRRCIKTKQFKSPAYVGDPINIVKIFNDKEVDELIVLDIGAESPDFNYLEKIASNAFMPLAYGGGIKKLKEAKEILKIGFEKVVINRLLRFDRKEVKNIINSIGSQSVVASIDIKKNIFGKYYVYGTKLKAENFINDIENLGIGEFFLTFVDREGTFQGYDIEFLQSLNIKIPVIVNGGAGTMEHIFDLFEQTDITAAAAGSMFVFYGKYNAVLITYPTEIKRELDEKMR